MNLKIGMYIFKRTILVWTSNFEFKSLMDSSIQAHGYCICQFWLISLYESLWPFLQRLYHQNFESPLILLLNILISSWLKMEIRSFLVFVLIFFEANGQNTEVKAPNETVNEIGNLIQNLKLKPHPLRDSYKLQY